MVVSYQMLCGYEPYIPSQITRQFGFVQCIPSPYLPSKFLEWKIMKEGKGHFFSGSVGTQE